MPQTAKSVLDRYSTVTPCLVVENAAKAIEFYQKAFGAEDWIAKNPWVSK